MKKNEKLTPKQKLFCLEYLKTFNGTEAYKKAYGGTDVTARVNASKLLTKTNISEFIKDKSQQKIEKEETGVEYVIRNLKEIIEIGMGRQAIELKGKEQKIYDLKNVNSALEKLGKYHKMYTDKIEQDATVQIQIVSYKDKEEGK